MRVSIFKQLFLSYSAIFLLLLFSLFGFLYLELSAYLDIRASKEILLSTSIKRQQLESHLKQQFVNLNSWVKLDVMNDVITQDADLRITQALETFKKQYDLSGHLYVLSNSGALIATDQDVEPIVNFSIWMSAIQTNHTLIDKHLSPLDQQFIIALWQPIHASFNQSLILGYLVMTYPWLEIENLQDFSDIHTHLILFNQSGGIAVMDKHLPQRPTQKNMENAKPQSWTSSLLERILIGRPILDKTHHEINLGDSTYFVHELKNTAKTPLTNLWHWFALAEKNQFYTPMQHILKIGFFIGLITLFLTLTVILFISRKISYPIKLLTETAEKIALTLDLSERVPVYGKNELSRLAIAFNDMSSRLSTVWQEKEEATKALEVMNHELERKIAERTKHLSWQAMHDPLTGLPNRALLSERLSQAIQRSDRDKAILAVLFIDLDGFKAVNDMHGHDQGDFLLKELAQRFLSVIREPDTIARLGGDEFVILLQLQNLNNLKPPLKRIVDLVNQPINTQGGQLKVSPSIGVTIYPDDDSDADGLIRHADQAMYDAKQKGRNQVQFFNVQMDKKIHSEHYQRAQIKEALAKKQFVLYYQPQINILTGDVVGAEALIRWQHPERGLIFPDDFLPAIEQTDLIIEVGVWIMKQACQQLKHWNALGFQLKLSVNVASRHIQHPDFFNSVVNILAGYPEVQANQLILEITESATMQNIASAKATLQNCHNHNVRIALDDFGTGYSSLAYLRQLPVSLLKIDKSFVIDMLEDSEDKAIVEGVISLANIFKLDIVAEGVETQAHLTLLKSMDCTFAQGYAIAKPLPEGVFITWMIEHTQVAGTLPLN